MHHSTPTNTPRIQTSLPIPTATSYLTTAAPSIHLPTHLPALPTRHTPHTDTLLTPRRAAHTAYIRPSPPLSPLHTDHCSPFPSPDLPCLTTHPQPSTCCPANTSRHSHMHARARVRSARGHLRRLLPVGARYRREPAARLSAAHVTTVTTTRDSPAYGFVTTMQPSHAAWSWSSAALTTSMGCPTWPAISGSPAARAGAAEQPRASRPPARSCPPSLASSTPWARPSTRDSL